MSTCPWCGDAVAEDDDCHGPADYCDHPAPAPDTEPSSVD